MLNFYVSKFIFVAWLRRNLDVCPVWKRKSIGVYIERIHCVVSLSLRSTYNTFLKHSNTFSYTSGELRETEPRCGNVRWYNLLRLIARKPYFQIYTHASARIFYFIENSRFKSTMVKNRMNTSPERLSEYIFQKFRWALLAYVWEQRDGG